MPLDQVCAAVPQWRANQPAFRVYRDYLDGRHQLRFASRDFETKFAEMLTEQAIRENLCPAVVSAITDTVSVTSWGTGDATDAAAEAGLSRLLDGALTELVGVGEAWILAWPNAAGEMTPHLHPAGSFVGVPDQLNPDQLDHAVHLWFDGGYARAVVYGRDRAERFIARAPATDRDRPTLDDMPQRPEQWRPYGDDGDPEVIANPVAGVCPVIWLPDRSILHDVIPIQDALNKSLASMIVNEEAYARPFWYLLNYRPSAAPQNPYLPTTAPSTRPVTPTSIPQAGPVAAARKGFDPAAQQIFTTDSAGPFGQLDPPDMTRLLKIQDGYAQKIARIVGIPAFYFSQASGDVPSGESLRVLRGRMTGRVSRLIRTIEPPLRGLMALLGYDVAQITFADLNPPTPLERLTLAAAEKDLGLPSELWLRTAGYDPTQQVEGGALADVVAEDASAATAGRLLAQGRIDTSY